MRHAAFLLSILAATPGVADQYQGSEKLWFTLAAMPMQATGTAGRAVGMERFPAEATAFEGLRTECFGWADDRGLGRGHCLNIAPNGDLWVETYACEEQILPPPGAISACRGTLAVLGGTGAFAAMRGQGHFTMLTTTIAPDGMQVVYAPGEFDLRW